MKTCKKCGKTKSERGYNHDYSRKDGLEDNCRKCQQLSKTPGIERQLCDTPGCEEHRRRYHRQCDICLADTHGTCDVPGCDNPRAPERRICSFCRLAMKKANAKIKRCLTPGCNKVAPVKMRCGPCTTDHEIPELLLNSRPCSKCGTTKPLFEFGRWKKSDDGRAKACRICSSAKHAEASKKRRDRGTFETMSTKYHELGSTLGFVCSVMLSYRIHETIQPEWRAK